MKNKFFARHFVPEGPKLPDNEKGMVINMENYYGFAVIIGMCVIVLAIISFKRKSEFIINFIFRAVMGTIAIYFMNQILVWQQIDLSIGLNPLTVLTSGTLGFPGVVLLYGINLYRLL